MDLKEMCSRAFSEGKMIDLSECSYGRAGWDNSFINEPQRYYYFLAGFIRTQGLSRVLELGTHYGGSIISMMMGLKDQDRCMASFVTVDVSFENETELRKFKLLKRIQGDVLDRGTIQQVCEAFGGKPIDLLYIDTLHEYAHTATALAIYANRLRPKYMLLDDISLNESMKKLWKEIKAEFKEQAFDVSEIMAREGDVGFGVIKWNNAFKLKWKILELYHWVRCFLGKITREAFEYKKYSERFRQFVRPRARLRDWLGKKK